MDEDVRAVLLELTKAVVALQSQAAREYRRLRALQIVVAQATDVDLKSAEASLQKIEESLELSGEASQQASAIIELLNRGKNPNDLDT